MLIAPGLLALIMLAVIAWRLHGIRDEAKKQTEILFMILEVMDEQAEGVRDKA